MYKHLTTYASHVCKTAVMVKETPVLLHYLNMTYAHDSCSWWCVRGGGVTEDSHFVVCFPSFSDAP